MEPASGPASGPRRYPRAPRAGPGGPRPSAAQRLRQLRERGRGREHLLAHGLPALAARVHDLLVLLLEDLEIEAGGVPDGREHDGEHEGEVRNLGPPQHAGHAHRGGGEAQMDQQVHELHHELRKLRQQPLQQGPDRLHLQDAVPERLVAVAVEVGPQGEEDKDVVEDHPPQVEANQGIADDLEEAHVLAALRRPPVADREVPRARGVADRRRVPA
mmetsp:Transcript_48426/g.138390  ORF Transcript_48426/g.138390 Transcript_48426/m.138390 type:complete len:216 (-) Transcript_48426:667-1314(-)